MIRTLSSEMTRYFWLMSTGFGSLFFLSRSESIIYNRLKGPAGCGSALLPVWDHVVRWRPTEPSPAELRWPHSASPNEGRWLPLLEMCRITPSVPGSLKLVLVFIQRLLLGFYLVLTCWTLMDMLGPSVFTLGTNVDSDQNLDQRWTSPWHHHVLFSAII